MKASEMRQLSIDEQKQKVAELKEELFNLRFQQETGQMEKTSKIRQTRKDIARILTIISETNSKQDN
ncbi:MAG: 50S ribosomal protein L29 [Desulfobacterales bacterium]|nr:50S ribosomal protein L29 [Desulfobacterales bacterium]